MTSGTLKHALRALMLPTRVQKETDCGEALGKYLSDLGVAHDDYLTWIHVRLDDWANSQKPHPQLMSLVKAVLCANCTNDQTETDAIAIRVASQYFIVHSKLLSDHLMPFGDATAFLSYAFVLADLAKTHSYSSAQIAVLVASQPLFSSFGRQAIATVLSKLQILNGVSLDQIKNLFEQDAVREGAALVDTNISGSSELVSERASALGFHGDMFDALCKLSPTVKANGSVSSPFTPYLQILHYQCSLTEFVDHDVTDFYEFAPRGPKGQWLQRQYPHAIAGAGNPFLNNAKSVEVPDRGWVRSKKLKERPGALALLEILTGLQGMTFFARREVAYWIRMWLHRIIRVSGQSAVSLPKTVAPEQIERLIGKVSNGDTHSFGVIEQRVVDAIAFCRFPAHRSRGLGDSVNATNLSNSKFGDCEFLDPTKYTITAFEAHAGQLSRIYIEEHIASMRKSLPKRIPELTSITDLSFWRVDVTFVAHTIIGNLEGDFDIAGLKVKIQAITFREWLSKKTLPTQPQLVSAINEHVLKPLREYRTPNDVRNTFLEILS